ncbi:uncharacterized protein LOC135489713 [Lineus longissimus]|uniref:uncharacterized protein LOC135489713 n=1 Tax=Lineus longissimus TaxID=88925 RepID=UPI002B4EF7C8
MTLRAALRAKVIKMSQSTLTNGLALFAGALLLMGQSAAAAFTIPDSVGLGTIYRQGTCTGATQISSTAGTTLKQCSDACSGVSNCVAFMWHETGTCSLMSDSCATVSTADAQSHFFDMLPFDFFHRPASDCPGGDLAYLPGKTLSNCLSWCTTRSFCVSANWHAGGICYPKSMTCANANLGNIANNFFDKTGSFDIVRGYTYSAGDCLGTNLLQLPRRTIKLCAWECTSRANCRSYVWTKWTGDCQLKSDVCTAAAAADKHMYVRIMTPFGWYPSDNTPPEFLYHLSTEAELPSTFSLVGKTKKDFTFESDLMCAHRCSNVVCALFKVTAATCSIYV